MNIRPLQRDEIPLIWQIDRREVIDNIYYLRDGKLVLEPEHYDMQGWPPGEAGQYTPILLDCYERGGFFWGAFENETLIGVAVLESKWIGLKQNMLQMKFLHVSRDCRGQGLGKKLFDLAVEKAKELGAKKLYISATPSEHTVNYYMRLGCVLATEIDPELFALEPEDIHLEYGIS
ncbi:MAG TPA: GNAT family N-acetyltransferase [Anaerolineales bacterium]|nr:GNAT family N-acetyltransferase [Anaerolineales bacterium]